ncbi:hypothetical protein KEJ39_03265 [Candidatus Bathyarchaeota archaeon]|nr:hypothetical protein [Candidatus Bathyarchaeota archaeon]
MPRKKRKTKAPPKSKKPSAVEVIAEQVRNIESRLQESLKQLEAKTGEFLDKVEFESRISDIQSRVLESIPRMEAELKSIETRVARAIQKPDLEAKLTEIEKRMTALTAEVEALKGRVRDLEIPEV